MSIFDNVFEADSKKTKNGKRPSAQNATKQADVIKRFFISDSHPQNS